jgi:DnaK suppressor protein
MGKKQLQNFKRILAERILTLQDSIDRTIHYLKKGKEALPDPYDLAASEADTSIELAIRERDRFMLLSLHEALGRIEKGCYGICEQCGETIAEKRLMANPATTVCIDCKAEAEHFGKRGPVLNPVDMTDALRPPGERVGR